MKCITLISDWKIRDPYIAMFKGRILSLIPEATILDITHAITPYDIEQTAFILQNSYSSFPNNSLHIILTATSFSTFDLPVIAFYDNHAFLSTDNGIFSILFEKKESVQAHQYQQIEENKNIPYIDKLLEMIQSYFNQEIEKKTVPYTNFRFSLKKDFYFLEKENKISGRITYIDSFCNAVTNIPISFFKEKNKNHKFTARIPSSPYFKITNFFDFYNGKEEDPYFVSNRLGFLEITMFQAHVATLGGLKMGDEIEIFFE